jgi:pilus assembly protein CpaE
VYPISLGLIIETQSLWDDLHPSLSELPVRVVLEQNGIPDWSGLLEKLERLRPDVVLVDITKLSEPMEDLVQRLRSNPASPSVFALHTAPDPDLILRALRSGASEYLYPPFGKPLEAALERVSAERAGRQAANRPGGRAIGFLSAKGGCGATTLASNVGIAIAAKSGQKVLVADFDLDAGLIGFLLKSKSPYSVGDALRNTHRLDTNYWSALVSNGIPNVEVLTSPAPPTTVGAASSEQIQYVLRFGRTQYDWLVLDLGRSLSPFTFRTVEELDELYLVANLEIPALHQAKQTIQRLLDSGYGSNRIRLVMNRVPKRTDITMDELKDLMGVAVYAVVGNDYNALQEAYAEGKLLDLGSSLGRNITELAVKIAGIQPAQQKKKFPFF